MLEPLATMIIFFVFLPFLGIQAVKANVLHPRILNGRSAYNGECKSCAAIFRYLPMVGYVHIGGGTVLNKDWILSGARIVKTIKNLRNILIKVGFTNEDTPADKIRTVEPIGKAVHEDYNGKKSPYDIALLKSGNEIFENECIKYAHLPESLSMYVGEARLFGFGRTADVPLAPNSNNLKAAKVQAISKELCQLYIDQEKINKIILYSHICTHVTGEIVSVLHGDYGGPLIRYLDNMEEEVIGIISWRIKPHGRDSLPSISTRVSYFIQWINLKMRQHQ